jgi:hypothetical protein
MTWGNPWAWAGLVTVALPILIHLLGRGHARVHRFPTLRFLEASRLLPTRRTRVHDWWLLVTRVGILAVAVAALAQPALRTANRTRALGRALARAIVLDTSFSMLRATPAGERAIDAARREARRLASEAQSTTLIETRTPARGIAAAIEWLNRQPGRGELVVVSDFQSGALDAVDLSAVPREFGVRLARIPVSAAGAVEVVARSGDMETVARTTLSPTGTAVDWTTRPAATRATSDSLVVLAGPNERAGADASARAAATLATRTPLDSGHVVAIVYPQFPQRADLWRGATTPHAPWSTDRIARLRSDSLLIGAATSATASSAADTAGGLVVARAGSGLPMVIAKQDTAQGRERLLLFSFADAGSLTSAALIAATTSARSMAPPLVELDPTTLPDATLALWQRAPAAEAPPRANADGTSDGRWLWMVVLALLALETWMRALPSSGMRAHRSTPDASDRAA